MRLLSIYLAVFIVGVSGDGFYEGETCTHNGRSGTCKNIRSCQSAIEDIAKRRPPKTCSFQGTVPVVCCFDAVPLVATLRPTRAPQTSTTTTTEYVPPTYDYHFSGGESVDDCEPIPANQTSARTGRKAWDKCIEYQEKYIYPCEKGVALSGDKVRGSHCNHNADELIVGGVDAKFGEFPHMALLGYGNSAEAANWFCGGSVLSERFVLTAGHCTSNRDNIEVTFVRTAMLKRNDTLDLARVYRVARVVKHPQYDPPRRYNDIALLQTQSDIRLDQFVVPACLPIGSSLEGARASAIGFGLTQYRGRDANNLQKVTLTKFTTDECSENFQPDRLMKDGFRESTQVCYGDKEKSKDTCQGDSGGPLHIHNQAVWCTYTLVGVTSFGRACGFVGEPGLYTRVSAYTPWIESVVWP